MFLDDEVTIEEREEIRFGQEFKDGTLLKIQIDEEYQSLYSELSKETENRYEELRALTDETQPDSLFNKAFMLSFYGKTELLKLLLLKSDKLLHQTTEMGNTILHAAAAKDRVGTALFLAKSGANMHEPNFNGLSPLQVAIKSGAYTCERQLRLSQWAIRQMNLTILGSKSKHSNCESRNQLSTNIDLLKKENQEAEHSSLRTTFTIQPDPVSSLNFSQRKHSEEELLKPSSESNSTHQLALPTARRVKSAPPSTVTKNRNVRLCRELAETKEHSSKVLAKNYTFKLTKPQYLQFIKSSTGIIKEDYFADIFPEDEPTSPSPVKKEKTRHERITLNMLRSSGILDGEKSDSEDESQRRLLNQQAFNRWKTKKRHQKEQAEKEQSMKPSIPSELEKARSLTPYIMIGDTSAGENSPSDPNTYMLAYKHHLRQGRIKSAPLDRTKMIDPCLYSEWVESKEYAVQKTTPKDEIRIRNNPKLKKSIPYESWLSNANKNLSKQLKQIQMEKDQKKAFDEWLKQLKEESGVFEHWLRQKQERENQKRKSHSCKKNEVQNMLG